MVNHLSHNACANDFIHGDEVGYQGEITTCSQCLTEYSEFEYQRFIELDGKPVCAGVGHCSVMCAGFCGEWLSDDSIREYGCIVDFRDPTGNGKLVQAHAACAGDYLLMCFGVQDVTIKAPSREAIAAALVPALAESRRVA